MSTHRTREQWRAIIEQQRLSGLSQTRFCRQHGITTSAFSNARQRLGAVGVSAFVSALPPAASLNVDASTRAEHNEATPAEATVPLNSQHAAQLFLHLPGATLSLPNDISPRWLATLLREMAP